MATFRKRGGSWQAIVDRLGVYKSETRPTKAQAVAWATETEAAIIAGKLTPISNKTFGDLLQEYADKVSPTKSGKRWETIRIALLQRDEIASVKLSELDQRHFAQWRDRRLKEVSSSSVRREWNLLSSACKIAMNEWKWIKTHPMQGVSKPESAPPRDRRVNQQEIKNIQFTLGYTGGVAETKNHLVALAFEFACETAMRAQEICNLIDTDIVGNTANIRKSKTRAGVRLAPLTPRALEIIKLLPTEKLFDITPASLDALFRKAKAKLMIDDLTFHDSRHEGITRLAQKLSVLELARSVGHQDLRQLMIYYNESAEDIAKKLTI